MKNKIPFLIPFLLCAIAFFVIQANHIDEAKACRDCPFPSPLSSLHWLMPSGHSEFMVEEVYLGKGQIQSIVRLVDASTGELLAMGRLDHPKGRKRITIELFDKAGGKMEADVYYLNAKRDKVQIKLKCEKCNVDKFYLN